MNTNIPATFSPETLKLLQNLVVDWQSISETTISEISDFNWLWPAFEAVVCAKAGAWKADRDSLLAWSKDIKLQNTSIDYFAKRYTKPENQWLLNNLCNGDNRTMDAIQGAFTEEDSSNLTYGCSLVLYRLRNNLFHGAKGRKLSFSDQMENFSHANILLRCWLNPSA